MTKKCRKCNNEKPLADFSIIKATGKHHSYCKSCRSVYEKAWGLNTGYRQKRNAVRRKQYAEDLEAGRQKSRDNYNLHRNTYLESAKKGYYQKREVKLAYQKAYTANHKGKVSEYHQSYQRMRLKNDPYFRLVCNMRRRLLLSLSGKSKSQHTEKLLGCDIPAFKQYLENLFSDGMMWGNYGKVWVLDHKIPCVLFDLSKQEQQKICFHFSNLQPLEKTANLKKGARIL